MHACVAALAITDRNVDDAGAQIDRAIRCVHVNVDIRMLRLEMSEPGHEPLGGEGGCRREFYRWPRTLAQLLHAGCNRVESFAHGRVERATFRRQVDRARLANKQSTTHLLFE